MPCNYVLKTSSRRFKDVLEDKKMLHWRRLEDFFKTSSVRLHQDECLLGRHSGNLEYHLPEKELSSFLLISPFLTICFANFSDKCLSYEVIEWFNGCSISACKCFVCLLSSSNPCVTVCWKKTKPFFQCAILYMLLTLTLQPYWKEQKNLYLAYKQSHASMF